MELFRRDCIVQWQPVRAGGERSALVRLGDALRRRGVDPRLGRALGPGLSPSLNQPPFSKPALCAIFGQTARRAPTMTTLLYTHQACLEHDPGAYHPESSARLRAVLEALGAPEFARLERRDAPEAAIEDLARVHPRLFVE